VEIPDDGDPATMRVLLLAVHLDPGVGPTVPDASLADAVMDLLDNLDLWVDDANSMSVKPPLPWRRKRPKEVSPDATRFHIRSLDTVAIRIGDPPRTKWTILEPDVLASVTE
jgi:hypothetical protein